MQAAVSDEGEQSGRSKALKTRLGCMKLEPVPARLPIVVETGAKESRFSVSGNRP
jgi:hypothetical protein